MISNKKPKSQRKMPRKERAVKVEIEANVVGGRALRAVTGRRTREIHTACAKKVARKLVGEVRMESKRESSPLSEVTRERRKVPTEVN